MLTFGHMGWLDMTVLLMSSSAYPISGSIGVRLFLWVINGISALGGASIYLDFGLQIPSSGRDKNYLEQVNRRPNPTQNASSYHR